MYIPDLHEILKSALRKLSPSTTSSSQAKILNAAVEADVNTCNRRKRKINVLSRLGNDFCAKHPTYILIELGVTQYCSSG